ncbi:MAG: hypothetical protein QNJ81_12795 [Acidimicrobiia bacterium]|nr:hypothetical protein [Acidimicrobiia bacterium]
MVDPAKLATAQLARMRGMNRFYHERFFADVRFTTTAILALFVIGAWEVPLAYLLIPPVALLGAAQTAFDASYLIFSRHYAATLEQRLNEQTGANVLVAHEMERRYLFPLNTRKIVVADLGAGFSWFGYMTLLYTAAGVAALCFGLALGWSTLWDAGGAWPAAYLGTLGLLGLSALAVGTWWFLAGTGERRLDAVMQLVRLDAEPPAEST